MVRRNFLSGAYVPVLCKQAVRGEEAMRDFLPVDFYRLAQFFFCSVFITENPRFVTFKNQV